MFYRRFDQGDLLPGFAQHSAVKKLQAIKVELDRTPGKVLEQVVGYIKGKSAIHIARTYSGKHSNFVGQNFWARGYHVSTIGPDEETVRKYIQKQEELDKRMDQLELF